MRIRITGIRPIILSNPQTVKLSNPYAIISRKLNAELKAARKKGNEDKLLEIEAKQIRNDWESSAYWSTKHKSFYLPDTVVIAALRAGAAAAKKGKDIDRCVIVTEPMMLIESPIKHPSFDAYFADEAFHMECPCKVPPKTGSLIWKCRCMIPTGWAGEFEVDYDEDIIAEKAMREVAVQAGLVGAGGWRPKFGRFTAEILGVK